jgi:hypothetical protein
MKINITLNDLWLDDMPPEDKSVEELVLLVLKNAAGMINHIPRYNSLEITRCARRLILDGYIRGTIISQNECVWSKLTRKGRFMLEVLSEGETSPPTF